MIFECLLCANYLHLQVLPGREKSEVFPGEHTAKNINKYKTPAVRSDNFQKGKEKWDTRVYDKGWEVVVVSQKSFLSKWCVRTCEIDGSSVWLHIAITWGALKCQFSSHIPDQPNQKVRGGTQASVFFKDPLCYRLHRNYLDMMEQWRVWS